MKTRKKWGLFVAAMAATAVLLGFSACQTENKTSSGAENTEPVGIERVFMEGDHLFVKLTNGETIGVGDVKGEKGEPGKDGADGKDGSNGKNGVNGKDGINGKDGADGKDGSNGKDGADGKDGSNGKDGADGKDGINGRDGADGKDGSNGKDGADGKDGVGIKKVTVNQSGELIVTLTDGTILNGGKIDPCRHSYGPWLTLIDSTCRQQGLQIRSCRLCGDVNGESIPLKSHTYADSYEHDDNNHWRICSECGYKSTSAHTSDENGCCTVCKAQLPYEDGAVYALSEDKSYYILKRFVDKYKTEFVVPETFNGLPVKAINCISFTNLEKIVVSDTVTELGNSVFRNNKALKEIRLPQRITAIPVAAFLGCESLTQIVIPEGVAKIERGAFSLCVNLNTILFPTTLKHIEWDAFHGCQSLEFCEIPNGVTEIEDNIFNRCVSLKEIVIPDSVIVLDRDAFYNIPDLESIYYKGTAEQWAHFPKFRFSTKADPTIYFYSETEPAEEGNYWRLENGKIVVWEAAPGEPATDPKEPEKRKEEYAA